jgi:hypothetical protein
LAEGRAEPEDVAGVIVLLASQCSMWRRTPWPTGQSGVLTVPAEVRASVVRARYGSDGPGRTSKSKTGLPLTALADLGAVADPPRYPAAPRLWRAWPHSARHRCRDLMATGFEAKGVGHG